MPIELPLKVRPFPPGRRGVLLPTADRHAAALGVTMMTFSTPRPLALQRASFAAVRRLGARAVPARTIDWDPGVPAPQWRELERAWSALVGDVDAMAAYQRRQHSRGGLTAILTRSRSPVALLKLRSGPDTLDREQTALRAVTSMGPTTFSAPRALGAGVTAGHAWSLQSVVFSAPHRPAFDAPPELFEEVAAALAPLGDGGPTAHGDLTPWNLRLDREGRHWLYDWEDWAPAPAGADRVYYEATRAALTGRPISPAAPQDAVDHWLGLLDLRTHSRPDDVELNRHIRDALLRARATG